MSKVYNVAVLGCGQMGEVHLEHIYHKDNANIRYLCDRDIDKLKKIQKKYNADFIETDPVKCISDKEVDVVIIATYPSSHLKLLDLCMEHKKHVICEKPICNNLEDGEAFFKKVKNHKECKVLIGHILRHNKTYQKVASMIQIGAIGKPIFMRMTQNHHTMNWQRYLNLITETSPLIDCGVHYLDVMQWFTGAKITEISAIGTRTEPDVPVNNYNYGVINAKLSDGSSAVYEAGWGNTVSSENTKEFIGPKGRIKIVYQKDRFTNKEEGDLIEYYKFPENEYLTINVDSNRQPTDAQFDYLVNMIENDVPAKPTIDDAFSCFKLTFIADKQVRSAPDFTKNYFEE